MTTALSSDSPRASGPAPATLQAAEARMILIAGADLESMEVVASAIFDAGHVPVIGRWFSRPLAALSGLDAETDASIAQIVQPLTERLLARCDGVLRVGGASASADAMAGAGRARGLRVFYSVEEALNG